MNLRLPTAAAFVAATALMAAPAMAEPTTSNAFSAAGMPQVNLGMVTGQFTAETSCLPIYGQAGNFPGYIVLENECVAAGDLVLAS